MRTKGLGKLIGDQATGLALYLDLVVARNIERFHTAEIDTDLYS